MAWPQAPQPAPPPSAPAGGGTALPIGPLVTAIGGLLTFLFSFVQIVKADNDFVDVGWSVWTTQPGFFGVGTWIPFFALVAGAAALARAFAKGLADKQVLGFGLLQVQVVATLFAVLLWFGYVVSILLSEETSLGLGALLLFVGLAIVAAGTVLSILDTRKGTTTTISTSSGPPSGQWGAPTGPQPHTGPQPAPGAGGQWPQPTPPPPAQQPQPGQAPGGQWGAPAPGQWQPDPTGAPGPPPAPQTWAAPPGPEQAWPPPAAGPPGGPAPVPQPGPPGPVPEPGPLDPQPSPPVNPGGPPGGALVDSGTEVIPGPPPAPPRDDPGHVGGGPDAVPPGTP